MALCMLLLTVCAPAQTADWIETRQAGDFHIRANFALNAYPNLVAELDQLDRDLTATLQVPTRREPVHLLLFENEITYQQYVNFYFPGAPVRRALYIKGSQPGWVMAYVNRQFEVDVRHEGTHALLHSRLPMVPLWLDPSTGSRSPAPRTSRSAGRA